MATALLVTAGLVSLAAVAVGAPLLGDRPATAATFAVLSPVRVTPPVAAVLLPVARPSTAPVVEPRALPVAGPAVVANPRLGWGPTQVTARAALAAVRAMSLEQVAGQVLVARYPGTDPVVPAALVAQWHLGGVILMGENVGAADQLIATSAAVQAASQADGRSWPAVVAVDEEGGRVSRLAGVLATLPAFAVFGADGDVATTRAEFARLGGDLTRLGITMDMAPVADVTIGPTDPTIGDRSASPDPLTASRTVLAAMGGLLEGGAVPVLKHFPGHGSVTTDSHQALPVQSATVGQLLARDLVPFVDAVAAGAPVVMMGHLDLPQLDPGVPASLSAAAYRLLREDVGFEGVAMTDALDMGAVPSATPGDEAVRALAAGADLVLMPRDVGAAHGAIVVAVESGRLSREVLDQAAARVVTLQMWSADRAPRA